MCVFLFLFEKELISKRWFLRQRTAKTGCRTRFCFQLFFQTFFKLFSNSFQIFCRAEVNWTSAFDFFLLLFTHAPLHFHSATATAPAKNSSANRTRLSFVLRGGTSRLAFVRKNAFLSAWREFFVCKETVQQLRALVVVERLRACFIQSRCPWPFAALARNPSFPQSRRAKKIGCSSALSRP